MKDDFPETSGESFPVLKQVGYHVMLTRDDQGWPTGGMPELPPGWTYKTRRSMAPLPMERRCSHGNPMRFRTCVWKESFSKATLFGIPNVTLNVDVAFLGKELPPWNWCLRSAGFGSGATLVNQMPMVAWPPMCVSKQVPFWIYVTHTLIVIISTIWGVVSCTILFMSQQYIPICGWVKTWYYHQSIH